MSRWWNTCRHSEYPSCNDNCIVFGKDFEGLDGLYHPEKEKFSEELLRDGDIKANSEIQEIDGTNIRIRCIRYKDKIWFHHMKDGEILEIFEM